MKHLKRLVCTLAFIGPWSATAWGTCPSALNLTNFPELMASGQFAFEIDDEGLNATPLYLDMPPGQPNTSTGTFSGNMATSLSLSATLYPVTGNLTQVLNNGLSITFSYSEPNIEGIFTYNGAIALEESQCNLFMAGVYTVTIPIKIPIHFPNFPLSNSPPLTALVLGPFPFSAKAVPFHAVN